LVNVVIVGSGFSGTMVAVHLARQTRASADITIVERTGRFGAGVAYATPFAGHLLNVPAARMSAFPDVPDHFLRWAIRQSPDVRPESFVPRQWYSAYLAELLDGAKATAASGNAIRRLDAEVVGLAPGDSARWIVECANGRRLSTDVVVLAIGTFPPANPPCETPEFYETAFYRQDPWAADALTVDADDDVLVLGTGLTMIDVAVALTDQGHLGQITCVSRRGLLPQWLRPDANVPHAVRPPARLAEWPRTARGLMAGLRREAHDREAEGGDWRDAVASLRSETPALWRGLPLNERRRFLRHVRPFWDTHRHGAAPAIGRTIDHWRRDGRLRVGAGRVLRYDWNGRPVAAHVRWRGSDQLECVRVNRVVNCTGADMDLTRVRSPLVQHLYQHGMIRPDPVGIGVVTDDEGGVVDQQGRAQAGLYLAGPLRRGHSWENLAVPELREDVARLAEHVTHVQESLRPTSLFRE
jgi:uncharacterized NAD(P)/FAD-binding protein YdhS